MSSDSVTTSFGLIADSRVGVVVKNIEERDDRDGDGTDEKMTNDLTVFIRIVITTNVTAAAAPRKRTSGGDDGETGDTMNQGVRIRKRKKVLTRQVRHGSSPHPFPPNHHARVSSRESIDVGLEEGLDYGPGSSSTAARGIGNLSRRTL